MAQLKNAHYAPQNINHCQLPAIPKTDEDIQYFFLLQLQSLSIIWLQEWTAAQ